MSIFTWRTRRTICLRQNISFILFHLASTELPTSPPLTNQPDQHQLSSHGAKHPSIRVHRKKKKRKVQRVFQINGSFPDKKINKYQEGPARFPDSTASSSRPPPLQVPRCSDHRQWASVHRLGEAAAPGKVGVRPDQRSARAVPR